MGKYKFYSEFITIDKYGADICNLRFPNPIQLQEFIEEVKRYDSHAIIWIKSSSFSDFVLIHNGRQIGKLPDGLYSKKIRKGDVRHLRNQEDYSVEVEDE